MSRGRLRVFLGAAPGVGKTFAMLEEGHRLRKGGRDVAIGFVETHGRAETAALIGDLEVIPRARLPYRGGWFEEMDLDALLSRRPELALVDELAHTNLPGSGHEKRWHDVDQLLDAGIDVFTTLNIQHLESLNDLIYQITGVTQRETIPDEVVRRADEMELVDLTAEGVRERLAAGKIYPAERIDAALDNYFRPGNLGALRELALSWTADRVDEALDKYRDLHGIEQPWETKERVVLGIAGAPGANTVIRRAARMAMRSRAHLLGVFVRPTHGLADETYPALDEQRDLLIQLGGRYHEVVGDDAGDALLAFARAENATQIVVGATRRSRVDEWLRGSPTSKVIRESGTIDVHVITYEGARRPRIRFPHTQPGALGLRRIVSAWTLTFTGLPLLTWALLGGFNEPAIHDIILIYLLATVIIAVIGGVGPAVTAAIGGFLLANWFFTPPVRTWTIAHPDDIFTLLSFLVIGLVVGLLVGMATRRTAEARRARAQAEALAATSLQSHPSLGSDPQGLVRRVRDTFSLSATSVLRRTDEGWETLAQAGDGQLTSPESGTDFIQLTGDVVLVFRDGRLTTDDRRVLTAFATQITRALEREELEKEAQTAESLARTDRLRTALIGAVSQDLGLPVTSIERTVSQLLEGGERLSPEQARGLTNILAETQRLNLLVGRLLDTSRVEAGVVHVFFREVDLAEVVDAAVSSLENGQDRVAIDVPHSLPGVQTDPTLLKRVVTNLVENALTTSSSDSEVRVTAGQVRGRVDLRIIDRGAGTTADQPTVGSLGPMALGETAELGLAVCQGFLQAMDNELLVEPTPGGGTTMVIGLKIADRAARQATASPGRSTAG